MIDLDNQTTLEIDVAQLETIAQTLCEKEIELIITDNQTMKELNREHRGKEAITDVLSFPMNIPFTQQPISRMPLGSIIIAASCVHEKAVTLGHSHQDELSLLFIHGMLHLLGFDHEVDHGEMRKKEEEIIKQFHLPKSLIVRNQQ